MRGIPFPVKRTGKNAATIVAALLYGNSAATMVAIKCRSLNGNNKVQAAYCYQVIGVKPSCLSLLHRNSIFIPERRLKRESVFAFSLSGLDSTLPVLKSAHCTAA